MHIDDWPKFIKKHRWVKILGPYGMAHATYRGATARAYGEKRKHLTFFSLLGGKLDQKYVAKNSDLGFTFHFRNDAQVTQDQVINYLERDILLLFEKIKDKFDIDVTKLGYRFIEPKTLTVYHTFDQGLAFDMIGLGDDDELSLEIAKDIGRKFNQEEIAVGEAGKGGYVIVFPFYKKSFWSWLEGIRY